MLWRAHCEVENRWHLRGQHQGRPQLQNELVLLLAKPRLRHRRLLLRMLRPLALQLAWRSKLKLKSHQQLAAADSSRQVRVIHQSTELRVIHQSTELKPHSSNGEKCFWLLRWRARGWLRSKATN